MVSPWGPWQRGFLLRLQDSSKPHGFMFEIPETVKLQAAWWTTHLRAAKEESSIVDPRPMGRMNPVQIYTDAAGGDASKIKNGIGCYTPPKNWCYMPWPNLIRDNRSNSEGVKFAHKLCSLEGFAAVCGLASIPEVARNNEVVIHCDNAAFVAVFKNTTASAHMHTPLQRLWQI